LSRLFERDKVALTILAAASASQVAFSTSDGPSLFVGEFISSIDSQRWAHGAVSLVNAHDEAAKRIAAMDIGQTCWRFASDFSHEIVLTADANALLERIAARQRDQLSQDWRDAKKYGSTGKPAKITQGHPPIPIAVHEFSGAEGIADALSQGFTKMMAADLERTGLFALVDPATSIATAPFENWQPPTQVSGSVTLTSDGRLMAEYRLENIASGQDLAGPQHFVHQDNWRRLAHLVSESIHAKLTIENGIAVGSADYNRRVKVFEGHIKRHRPELEAGITFLVFSAYLIIAFFALVLLSNMSVHFGYSTILTVVWAAGIVPIRRGIRSILVRSLPSGLLLLSIDGIHNGTRAISSVDIDDVREDTVIDSTDPSNSVVRITAFLNDGSSIILAEEDAGWSAPIGKIAQTARDNLAMGRKRLIQDLSREHGCILAVPRG
jgi:hypothetical protein